MSTRYLTIGYNFTKSKATKKISYKPKIMITGEWLKNAGFEIGQNVEIKIKKNQLTIKNLSI